jgi:hypothetical protein
MMTDARGKIMRRFRFSRIKLMLLLVLAIVVPEQAFGPASM